MIHRLYSAIERGNTKDVLGPLAQTQASQAALTGPVVLFDFTDAWVPREWGKPVDLIPNKGEAWAVISAHSFERLGKAELWKEFSRSKEALALRKASRYGSIFNELGEEFQAGGLRSHYLGCFTSEPAVPRTLDLLEKPTRLLMVRQVFSVRPEMATVMGSVLPDYQPTRSAPFPRRIPAQVRFQFRDGERFLDFPEVRLWTNFEDVPRELSYAEALAISGVSAVQLQELLLRSVWAASLLRWSSLRTGISLESGTFQWALDARGQCLLTDSAGPDEFVLRKGERVLRLDFLEEWLHSTSWYGGVAHVRELAAAKQISEWKKHVTENPPPLPEERKVAASRFCRALANRLTGKTWFGDTGSLEEVLAETAPENAVESGGSRVRAD